MIIPTTMSASGLSALADQMNTQSVREDMEANRTRRAQKTEAHVEKAKVAIDKRRVAADKRHKAAKKRGLGGLLGKIFGAIAAAIGAVAGALTGAGIALSAVVITLLVSAGAVATVAAGLAAWWGNKKGADLDLDASTMDQAADRLTVDEKELDKEADDIRDQIKDAREFYQQIYGDARARQQERSRAMIG